MSRPVLLVFLLLVLIITSQFEWRQPLVDDTDGSPRISQKQLENSKREEAVKEKMRLGENNDLDDGNVGEDTAVDEDNNRIILSQEKNIQRLNKLVQSLREQLLQCKNNSDTKNATVSSLSENVIELERQQILED